MVDYEFIHDDSHGNIRVPKYIKSGVIGKVTDFQGRPTEENQAYMLIKDEFYPIEIVDGDYMIPISKRNYGDYQILHCYYEKDFRENGSSSKKVFVAKRNGITAHGDSVKQAMADVEFKVQQGMDVSEHIRRVKEKGTISPNDYRLLTGACQSGTQRFLEKNGYVWEDEKPIDEVIVLTAGQYGNDRLVELLKEKA